MQYIIKPIPKTEEGVAFHLNYYKPFRLKALQTDPSSFSSNYAREVAYDDEKWRSRLLNPVVTTLVALTATPPNNSEGEGSNERNKSTTTTTTTTTEPSILSATTVVGPAQTPPELGPVLNNSSSNHIPRHSSNDTQNNTPDADEEQTQPQTPTAALHWEINAVWTAPEARRKGIARHLLREAVHLVQDQAAAATPGNTAAVQGIPEELFLTVGVEKNNDGALSLYSKSGYVPFPEQPAEVTGQDGREFVWLYRPVPYSDLPPRE